MGLLSDRIRNVMDGMKGQDDEKRIALAEIAGVSTMLVENLPMDLPVKFLISH